MPVNMHNKGDEGIKENERFLKKIHNESHPLIKGMVGLHASFTVNDKTLKKAVKLTNKYNCALHLHVAEAESDEIHSVKKYKMRVVERLKKFNALDKKTILVHCVHINEEEMNLIKKANSIVIHNPESNMNNAVGWTDVLKMIKKGILVGLGTDGMSSNMLQQVRCAYLIAKNERKDPRVAFMEAPQMFLENNAEIIERIFNMPYGKIRKGYPADIILLNYLPPTPFNSGNFLGHLLFGLTQSVVDTTIVNGKILMENKKILVLDEKEISKKCIARARKFWHRFHKQTTN
jgi:cytosine/adenosine deaminase-related metal-dependent hydrolase